MGPNLSHLIKYKDLFLVFVWREFSIRYKQSIFGILWAFIQPLSMMFLFTFVFTYVMPVKVANYPYAIFFYSALLPWTFFSSSLNSSIPSLVGYYNLITKIYFPREILPLSGIAVAFIDFVVASSLFVVLMVYYKIPLSFNMFWFPFLLILLLLFTIAMSLILSALNVYYRDVGLAINFLMQLWFFASPIFYSIDKVPERIKPILFINPLAFIIENMRRCLVEGRAVIWWQYLTMFTFIAAISLLSYRFFKVTERKFADVI